MSERGFWFFWADVTLSAWIKGVQHVFSYRHFHPVCSVCVSRFICNKYLSSGHCPALLAFLFAFKWSDKKKVFNRKRTKPNQTTFKPLRERHESSCRKCMHCDSWLVAWCHCLQCCSRKSWSTLGTRFARPSIVTGAHSVWWLRTRPASLVMCVSVSVCVFTLHCDCFATIENVVANANANANMKLAVCPKGALSSMFGAPWSVWHKVDRFYSTRLEHLEEN